MAAGVFNVSKNNITITDLRVLLVKGYTPDADHATVAAIVASDGCDECTFTNYARKSLSDEAFSVINASDVGMLDATDAAAFTDAGGASNDTISHAIVYDHVGADDATNIPVSWHEVGITTNGATITLPFHANGIFRTA